MPWVRATRATLGRSIGSGGRRIALAAGLVVVGLLPVTSPAAAQQRLSFPAFVQWISGSNMRVVTDNGTSVRVDLRVVDQLSYNTLRGGDPVQVFGYVSPDRSRVIGERINRIDAPNVYDACSAC